MVDDFHLKGHMRFPSNDQEQPRPYFALFSHNTFVTDGQTTTRAIDVYSIAVASQ